ncbi:MAG: phenylacetate--CoA ligase [Clostridia bacterium]|nr:phenylacetate--CoA ligase [Clostridia bacterium]
MEQRYFQPELETMPREELIKLQSKRLVEQVHHVYNNVKFYHDRMDEQGIKPEDIHGIEDLHLLPFITKTDLRDQYPFGMLGVPLKDVVRLQATSGTTGKRVVAYYTKEDLSNWEDCTARAFVAGGATDEDIVHICFGYGLFSGGLGYHGGAHKVGCLTMPMSTGNTDRQLQFLVDMGATAICCTPSYAITLGEAVRDRGLKDQLKLRIGFFGAEPWTEEMRKDIESLLGLKSHDVYGLTEMSGPGVSFECDEQNGMHVQEDHYIPEIINPVTGEVLPEGQVGELVFTCLTKKAFPLIRYRTRDLCKLDYSPCPCGRTGVRMSKVLGRSDDMLIVKGVNVFPSQIESVLIDQGYSDYYQIIVDRLNSKDTIEVVAEMTPAQAAQGIALQVREAALVVGLQNMLGIKVNVKVAEPMTIPRSEGKAVRIIDKRKLYGGVS